MISSDPLEHVFPGTPAAREQRQGIAALRDQAVVNLGSFPPDLSCDILHMMNTVAASWLYVPASENALRAIRNGLHFLNKAAQQFSIAYEEGGDGQT